MEAMHYEKKEGGAVRCLLCPHGCVIAPDGTGRCGVRRNEGGVLAAATWGRVTSLGLDPMEKKPLYHFLPGRPVLSAGQNGCNLDCAFCQNWRISRGGAPEQPLEPEGLVRKALDLGSEAVAYTYNEPFVGFEYVLASARLAREQGLANVLVTNGYVSPGPLEELLPFVDAMNVDVKSMEDEFYRRVCRASLGPVLETLRRARGRAHLEVTNLVIPGENDEDRHFEALADWVAGHLGPDTPVHLSAYHPAHRMTAPPTPAATLHRAREALLGKLSFVYLGNLPVSDGRHTRCPDCGALLVERKGYDTDARGLDDSGACRACGRHAGFVLSLPRKEAP